MFEGTGSIPIVNLCTASLVVYDNPTEMLDKAIKSLPDGIPLTVVDNSAKPDLKEYLEQIPGITYHFSGNNLGYGRGHNLAVRLSPQSRYHLIMNPDIIISTGALESMLVFMEANSDIGMTCPRICGTDGVPQYLNRRHPTITDLFLRRFLPSALGARRRAHYIMQDAGYETVYDVESMTGVFMLCRRTVFDAVGGFDPRYFMYYEDFDLGRKFQNAGARTVYYPHAAVTHLWKRASHHNLLFTLVHIANMLRYFNKWGWRWW